MVKGGPNRHLDFTATSPKQRWEGGMVLKEITRIQKSRDLGVWDNSALKAGVPRDHARALLERAAFDSTCRKSETGNDLRDDE